MSDSADLPTLAEKCRKLQGPILVLGASGFVGANLLRNIIAERNDVYGTSTRHPAWRLEGLPEENVKIVDLLVESNLDALLDAVKPRTILNCVAYGAYSFEVDPSLIYRTNFGFITGLIERLRKRGIAAYIHAGSSSEYGDNASGPSDPRCRRRRRRAPYLPWRGNAGNHRRDTWNSPYERLTRRRRVAAGRPRAGRPRSGRRGERAALPRRSGRRAGSRSEGRRRSRRSARTWPAVR